MRRKLKNLKNKSGHSENGSPRQAIDEAVYRERRIVTAFDGRDASTHSGWSNASRPRDSGISIRRHIPSP